MPEYDKMTIEESLAQLNEDFDDSEWQQNLFIEYAESQSKEYQDLVFGRNAELTEKKDTPSEDTPQPSVNFNFGDIVWGFSKYETAVPKNKILYNGGERRLGFVINYDSKSVTCLQIVSANNKDRYNKNLFAIKIKDYDPNHPTQEGFVLCNKIFVSPLEYEYPAVDPKTKKFMEINGNLIVIQEHVRGNDFFKLPQKYKDEVYNKLKEFNGTYGVPKLPQITECNLNEEIKINDTLNKDLWDDNNELKEEVKDKLLDIADAFLDDLKEDGIDIQVEDIRLLGSNANYNYTDQSDLDLHIVAQIDPEKYEQQLYNCYKTIFNNKYDIKIKGREVEVYVEDVKAPAKSNGVYSLYTGWVKEPKKESIPTIDYDAFEKLFDEWEDDYFDIIDDFTTDEVELEESIDKERALLWKGQNYTLEPKNDFTRLYHQTNKENILSIIKNGLQVKKARKFDNPGDVIWLSNNMPEDYNWSYGDTLIEIDLPKDYEELYKVNATEYQCYKDIPSSYFNAIYLQTSYRKEIMKDFQNTLDLDKSIERFHKGELKESKENAEDIALNVFGEGKLGKGPMYLLPNGKFLNIPEPEQIGLGAFIRYKCHACVNAWLLYQKLIPGTLWDMNDSTLLLDRGWVRGNLGKLPDADALMNYLVLPKKRLTDSQFKSILEWLDYAQTIGVKSIEVNTQGMNRYKSYSFSDYTSDEIVDKIKKYYATNRLEESVEDDISFKLYTAGYILEDGSFYYLDEYHGENENLRGLELPEFSNTHPEEDTCIRIYKEPNEIQYKKLEEIIDAYLNSEMYCKVEIWENKKYVFYKVYSLVEDACEDYQWDEQVGNWTGYKLIQIIKNYFKKSTKIGEELTEVSLSESGNYAPLYHRTTIANAINIIKENTLKIGGKYMYNVKNGPCSCFSRDLKYVKSMPGKSYVIFVVNKDKLTDHYKLIPVSDNKNFLPKPMSARNHNSKAEEVCMKNIKSFLNYVDKILVTKNDYNKFIKAVGDLDITVEKIDESLKEELIKDDIIEVKLTDEQKDKLINDIEEKYQTHTDFNGTACYLFPDGKYVEVGAAHYLLDYFIIDWLFNEGIVNKELYDEDAYLQDHFVEEELGGIHCGNDSYSYIGVPANKEITKEQYKALGTLDKYYMDKEDGFSIEIYGAERPIRTTIYYDVDKGYLVDRYRRRTSTEATIRKYYTKGRLEESTKLNESAEIWDLDWYRAYNKNYDIFSTNNSYGGKDAYTWATSDLDYLDFIEDDEKVAKLKLKPCKLLFYNMTKDELDRLQDKYGKTMGKNWEYFDTVNPGDDEMNIINQEGYDGFYDSGNIYVKKEFLEVVDNNIQLNEKVEKVMDYDWDDHIPRCYVITTDDEMLRFIKNYQNWEQFKIVHDPVANLYIVGDPWDDTHMSLIDYAVDNGFYEPERAEVGKESEWDSIYDAIMNSTNQIYINFDDDDPEEYPFRKVFEFNNAPMYVYSYKEESIDDTPFLKSLKKLDEKFYQTKNHKYTSWDGQEKSYTTTEYNPKNDSKYKRLIKKPINELTLDEVKYIFAVKECIYMQQLKPYDTPEKAVEYYSNEYGKELEECYKFIHSLSFPLTIYRGIRVGNYDSSELNNITQELKISGKQQSRSWTTDINIYKNEKSKFKNITDIVACEIDSNIIDVPNTISNYVFYSTGKDELGRNYPENEISLKDNFKQSDLHNLRFVNKEDIIERLIYRGESDYNYSKLYKKNLGGLFFYGDDQSDYIKQYGTDSDYGPLVQYELDDNAKLYKGISSEKYCHDNPELWNKKDPVFIDLVKAVGAPPLAKDEYSLADIEKDDIAADSGNPDVWFAMCQYVAKEDLESKGYDGAEWSYEDELEPHQLQIWNLDTIKRVNNLKENYWKESDVYDLIENNFNVVDSIEGIDTSKGVILPNGKIVEIDDVHDDFLYFLIDKGIVKEDTYSADPFEPLYHWGCIRYVFSDVDYSGYCSMSENYKPNDKVLNTLKDVITESSYYDPIFSVEIGQNYRDYDLEVVKPDFVINRIKGYYSSGSLKESLLESKQDTENFRKWVEKKIREDYHVPTGELPGNLVSLIDIWVKWFDANRHSFKPPKNDYYYWIKLNDWDTFTKEVQEYNKKIESEKKAKDGAKLIYSDKDWKVYEITNYEAAKKYGKGTKWCISGSKRWGDGVNGEQYYNEYTKKGIKFYFFINSDGHKYALSLYPNNEDFEVFNDTDNSIAYIPDAPVIEEIPVDYYTKDNYRLFRNLLLSNQLPNGLSERLIFDFLGNDTNETYRVYADDLVNMVDDDIPDGYLEFEAVASGNITPEEYEDLTGDTYEDSNDYWGGDVPQVDMYHLMSDFNLNYDADISKDTILSGLDNYVKENKPAYILCTPQDSFASYRYVPIKDFSELGIWCQQRYDDWEEDLFKYLINLVREGEVSNDDLKKVGLNLLLDESYGIRGDLLDNATNSQKSSLYESFDSKVLRLPKEQLNRAMELFFDERPCKIEKVSIKKLVDDNGLLNDDDLESYHEVQWENKPAKEFSINTNKLNNMRASEIPYATERNGKLILGDGRHRVRAAYNDGYDFIELPVIREVE